MQDRLPRCPREEGDWQKSTRGWCIVSMIMVPSPPLGWDKWWSRNLSNGLLAANRRNETKRLMRIRRRTKKRVTPRHPPFRDWCMLGDTVPRLIMHTRHRWLTSSSISNSSPFFSIVFALRTNSFLFFLRREMTIRSGRFKRSSWIIRSLIRFAFRIRGNLCFFFFYVIRWIFRSCSTFRSNWRCKKIVEIRNK